MAGLTVGVMLVPQSMAYALLAGMPPQYGLYASIVPLLAYALLGTSRHLAVGVIAIDMIVISAGVTPLADPGSARYVQLVVALALLTGLLHVGMSFLKLGFLANLLSRPVIVGFAAAASILIGVSQVGNLLGIDLEGARAFYDVVSATVVHLGETKPLTTVIGLVCVALLLLLDYFRPLWPAALIVVVLATAATWLFSWQAEGVSTVGSLAVRVPPFAMPAAGWSDWQALLPTAGTLALVQFMSVISLGRTFATRHNYSIRPNQELFAIGLANVAGSFFRSIPVSGSFSRSAINEQAGAASPGSNVVAALVVFIALLLLTPLFAYLPMSALAAIIVVAAVGLIDVREIRYLFRAKERDGYTALITFLVTLAVGIQEGIVVGIVVATLAVLYRLSRPHVAELGHMPGTRSFRDVERHVDAEPIEDVLLLRFDASFSFFNAAYFKEYVLEQSERQERPIRAVVIDGRGVNDLDTTALEALRDIFVTLEDWGVDVYLAGLKGPIRDTLKRSGLYEKYGDEAFPMSSHAALKQILEGWDEQEGGERLANYMDTTAEPPPEGAD